MSTLSDSANDFSDDLNFDVTIGDLIQNKNVNYFFYIVI